jgi:phosphonate transport system substrate-binding protein
MPGYFYKYIMGPAILMCLTAPVAVNAVEITEINFGVVSTESQSGLKSSWGPFLQDMEKQIGLKINQYFATDYAGMVEAMRFNKVQVVRFGNKSAIEAVDRSNGEVFAQVVELNGNSGYWSVLITHKDSDIKGLDDILHNGKKYTFGNGDPNSTSGYLVPGYYIFAANNIDPAKHFKRMVHANHETNALSVANRQVDFATCNNIQVDNLKKNHPEAYRNIRIIWKSPLIPESPFVWRKDLPEDVKAKIKVFFVNYGKTEREKKVLANISRTASFQESSNDQLVPIRQLELYKLRVKLEADDRMDPEEKRGRLEKINAELAALGGISAGK